jgi:PTS system mannose-specific IIC component
MLLVIGTLCALDTVSVAQSMISRPIVSATLAGAALGRAEQGVVVGAVLELFALETMPFGASRYPEWGSAGVTAGATFALGGSRTPGALAVAVIAGLLIAGLGSISMVWHRRTVARLAGALREPLAAGSASAVFRLHAAGIASDLWRGAAVTSIGIGVASLLSTRVLDAWGVRYGPSLSWPLIAAVAVGGFAVARSARPTPYARWYLVVGLGIGAIVVLAA